MRYIGGGWDHYLGSSGPPPATTAGVGGHEPAATAASASARDGASLSAPSPRLVTEHGALEALQDEARASPSFAPAPFLVQVVMIP